MLAWLWLPGCPVPTGIPGTDLDVGDTDTTTAGETDTDVPSTSPVAFAWQPLYESNDGPARLVGTIVAETTRRSTLRVDVDDGVRTWSHTSDGLSRTHEVQIRGLRPDAAHELLVTATAEDGTTVSATVAYTTQPLPADFPELEVRGDPRRMEPGVTFAMFNPYVAMVDPSGEVRWYMEAEQSEFFTAFTERETFLVYGARRTALIEYDLEGRVVQRWRAAQATDEPMWATPVDVIAFHHDAIELPNGNLLALSVEEQLVEDFPSSEVAVNAPPADRWVAGDVVVEFERDGTVVHRWPLLDILDPLRIGYDSLTSDFWEAHLGPGTADWSHANAVWYDAESDQILVSLRHQDAVVSLDRATGDLQWILGPETNWRDPWDDYVLRPAAPDMLPFYHQHGAKLTPGGTLMVFDNGNYRASAFEPRTSTDQNFSRGLEITIDQAAGTWEPVFTFGKELDPRVFAGSHGDCDPLPVTDNVLVTFGSVLNPLEPGVQIFEVTRSKPHQVVFELTLEQPYITGRAERLTGVLPGF